MASNTLQADRATGQVVQAADVNEFRTALKGTQYVRDSTTRAPSHEADDICDATHRARRVYTKYLNLNGTDIDITAIKASGIDIVVNASGGADYTTITAALAAASSGDVILVMDGTYTESPTISTQGITLRGQGFNTRIEGDFLLSNTGCILERFYFSDQTKTLTVNGGLSCFIDKVWVKGEDGTNFVRNQANHGIYNVIFIDAE